MLLGLFTFNPILLIILDTTPIDRSFDSCYYLVGKVKYKEIMNMAHYIQAGVDKENAEKLKKHAKAEREKKINSFFEKITLRIQKRKQHREAAKAEKQ